MVGRRRIPRNPVAVPAGWFIALSVVACVSAAGWLGVMLLGPSQSAVADDAAGSSAPSLSTPSPAATTSPTTPAPADTATAPRGDLDVEREAPVSVLNNTGIKDLAQSFSAEVSDAGWVISGVGNWRGEIVSNTVYYPDGFQGQAQVLAEDTGISRVLPSIVPMRMDRLTIILSGPQE